MTPEDINKILTDNFEYLQALSVKEYTLYRKWVDIRERYPVNTNPFFDEPIYPELETIKENIWIPEHLDDYLKLEPEMVMTHDKTTNFNWNSLRSMCHSAVWHASPGRLLRYYIIDKPTGKFLGFISLGSDFIYVGGRDIYIGWSTDDKLKRGRLRHTAMGSSIAAVQPFGYNYNGGKLMAMLTASDVVQAEWMKRYGEHLVGVTTTSLYGGGSMYNRLVNWRKCKSTNGDIPLEPSEDVYHIIKNWYKEYDPISYKKVMSCSHPKTRTLGNIYKLAGVKPPQNNAPRGVYWNELFDNTKDFLCCKTDKVGEKKYDNSVEALTEIWKTKYATKRITNMVRDERVSNDVLFYNDMIVDDWDTIHNRYIDEV